MNCSWCDEPIEPLASTNGFEVHIQGLPTMHAECAYRSVVGSVAHVVRRCECFKPGSTLGDPPKLSKREAAKAAHNWSQQIAKWWGIQAI